MKVTAVIDSSELPSSYAHSQLNEHNCIPCPVLMIRITRCLQRRVAAGIVRHEVALLSTQAEVATPTPKVRAPRPPPITMVRVFVCIA